MLCKQKEGVSLGLWYLSAKSTHSLLHSILVAFLGLASCLLHFMKAPIRCVGRACIILMYHAIVFFFGNYDSF
jgi:hypothetical protein